MTGVLKFAPTRVAALGSACMVLAATSLAAPAAHAAPGSVAGMIVFLDPGHNGANDASMTRQVPTGRGGTKTVRPPAPPPRAASRSTPSLGTRFS